MNITQFSESLIYLMRACRFFNVLSDLLGSDWKMDTKIFNVVVENVPVFVSDGFCVASEPSGARAALWDFA